MYRENNVVIKLNFQIILIPLVFNVPFYLRTTKLIRLLTDLKFVFLFIYFFLKFLISVFQERNEKARAEAAAIQAMLVSYNQIHSSYKEAPFSSDDFEGKIFCNLSLSRKVSPPK